LTPTSALAEPPSAHPAPDEVEFSAFGPGYGECLLIHVGGGEWVVVDSCVGGDRPPYLPVLTYLERLGVDAAEAVKLVVATHWHDDHVRGMGELVRACRGAVFALSDALKPDEVQGLLGLPPSPAERFPSGLEELTRAWTAVKGRRAHGKWALQERELYGRAPSADLPVRCRVHVLAPSDAAVTRAREEMRPLLEAAAVDVNGVAGYARVKRPDRNAGAVVLCVDVVDETTGVCTCLLLGADLEEVRGKGWTGVLQVWGARGKDAEVLRVPHHGSKNAHHADVWGSMLTSEPHAVVCPYVNGDVQLPTDEDRLRLCGLTPNVHATALGGRETLRRAGKKLDRPPPLGQVTLRRRLSANAAWEVAYGGAAGPACAG